MEKSYIGIKILKILEYAKAYNEVLVELADNYLIKNNDVLDFGSGIGSLSDIFSKKYNYNIKCLENNQEEITILKNKGYEVVTSIEKFEDNSLVNIVTYNVLEHIEDDKEVLCNIYRKLKIGGCLFIFVPACRVLYSSFDKELGHIRRYEKEQLLDLLVECGFKINDWRFFDSLGYMTAYVYKIIKKDGSLTNKQVLFYDKILFPISKFFDFYFNKFFGKNIYVVATK